ncbi:unnamed protein product [Brassica oleracea]
MNLRKLSRASYALTLRSKSTPHARKYFHTTRSAEEACSDQHLRERLLFPEFKSKVNPKAVLDFFRLASDSFSFPFSLRSYCLLIGLLLESNLLSPARLFCSCFDQEIRRRLSDLLIEVYCTELKRDGCYLALEVFLVLGKKGMFPSNTTCNVLLTSLVRANEFQKCCEAFEVVCKGVSPDVYLFTTAINAFCKGGKVEEGIVLFSKMEEAGVAPNVVTYNTVIDGLGMIGSILVKGLIKAKGVSDACCVLKEMTEKGFPPNVIVYNNLIDGLIEAGSLSKAVEVKDDMVSKGLSLTSSTYNTLIKGYCKNGQADVAERLLKEMLSMGLTVNQGSFTSVICLLCSRGMFDSALCFVGEMLLRNMSPGGGLLTTLISGLYTKTSNALLHGLCEAGKLEEAFRIQEEILGRGFVMDTVSYNTLISGYCRKRKMEEAFRLMDEMVDRGLKPNNYTYIILIFMINGCCKAERAEEGQKLFDEMVSENVQPNTVVYNHLIRAYCRSERLSMASDLSEDMRHRGILPNSATYTSLIKGMSIISRVEEARLLLKKMKEGLEPNVFHYTSLIDGYGKLGQMVKVECLLREMHSKNIVPNKITYTVMIGGYARDGNVTEASRLLNEMREKGIVPDSITYKEFIYWYLKQGVSLLASVLGENSSDCVSWMLILAVGKLRPSGVLNFDGLVLAQDLHLLYSGNTVAWHEWVHCFRVADTWNSSPEKILQTVNQKLIHGPSTAAI